MLRTRKQLAKTALDMGVSVVVAVRCVQTLGICFWGFCAIKGESLSYIYATKVTTVPIECNTMEYGWLSVHSFLKSLGIQQRKFLRRLYLALAVL